MDRPQVYPDVIFDLTADLPWDRPSRDMVAIYALDDPATGELRYIGKTSDPVQRARDHAKLCRDEINCDKGLWVQNLIAAGLRPTLRVLAWVPRREWRVREMEAIAAAREQGALLLNSNAGGGGSPHGRPSPAEHARRSAAGKKQWRTRPLESRLRTLAALHEGSRRHKPSARSIAALVAYNTSGRTPQWNRKVSEAMRRHWQDMPDDKRQAHARAFAARRGEAQFKERCRAGMRSASYRASKQDNMRRLNADPAFQAKRRAGLERRRQERATACRAAQQLSLPFD